MMLQGKLREAAELQCNENILRQIREKECNAIEVCYHQQCYLDFTRKCYTSASSEKYVIFKSVHWWCMHSTVRFCYRLGKCVSHT